LLDSSLFMIVIVDYDTGNLASIKNMLAKIGRPATISADPDTIAGAEKLILPGVGHFDYGMGKLRERNLIDLLTRRAVAERVPTLGICLGAQLMTERSEEGELPGLGWLPATTIRFRPTETQPNLKIPHMGWTDTLPARPHPLFRGLETDARFYYVHSYHFEAKLPEVVLARASYAYEFPSALVRDNILAVQFHPEKSHRYGMKLLENFSAL
jgi:imidazole glycerol-phosphate synthase subunit HisH